MTIKELSEKRGEALGEIQRLRDIVTNENRDFTADERTNWDAANSEYDRISDQISIVERTRQLEEAKAIVEPAANPGADFRTLLKTQSQIDIPLFRSAPKNAAEARTMSTTTDSQGGYLVPETLSSAIEIALLEHGGVRDVATIIRTASGNPLSLPTIDDTSNSGSVEGENDALANTDVVVGEKVLNSYKVSSDIVKVPYELLEDSAFDLATLLGDLLGTRIARNASDLYTTGSGSSTVEGIVTGAALGKTAAGAAAITADELLDLVYSVGTAYRRNGTFMANSSVLLAIRKLKDSQNQYIWGAGLNSSTPDTLFGYPVVANDDMAGLATTNKTVLFGDLSKYFIRDVGNGVRLIKLDQRFADNDQIGWVGLLRTDGVVNNAGTNPIKYLQQA